MKHKIILIAFIAALATGCSSAYKASQTPDDVYFSPARKGAEQRAIKNEDRYEDYVSSQEDQYLRMKTRNRNRWSAIDDYSYWNDTRYVPSFSYGYYTNNWNSFSSWNNPYMMNNWSSPYYNPLYLGGYNTYGYNSYGYGTHLGYNPYSNVYISKYPVKASSNVNRPALSGYSNRNYNNRNGVYNRQGLGNSIKKVFVPNENNIYSNRNINNNNNTNNTYRAPERTYTPSPRSSNSSSGGTISRPSRH